MLHITSKTILSKKTKKLIIERDNNPIEKPTIYIDPDITTPYSNQTTTPYTTRYNLYHV